MITRQKWTELRDTFFECRSIAETARRCGISETTAAKFITLGARGFPAIKNLTEIAEQRRGETFIETQSKLTKELLAQCNKLRLKVDGKRNVDGTITVSTVEYARLMKMIAEAHQTLADFSEYAQENLQTEAGVVLPRQITHVVNQNEHRQCEERWRKFFNDWASTERRYLTEKELQLP
ncbi:MAG TPA: hypothetical protein PKL84_05970, partial [Candidatus Hydrogenedentes bacterium]|nr:hypothetical protein [Candidatus Hydrogenedentota bacterium]